MPRLVSLDVLRGATIASMILVNNPGSWAHVFPPLRHAVWHGWTFTDLVFPFFLWMVGLSLTFSFARRVEAGADRAKLYLHTLRRGAAILGLGLFLNLVPLFDFAHVRIPGVLQRIGICYLLAAAIFLLTSTRGLAVAVAVLLVFYTVLMTGHGYADPWSIHNNYARSMDSLWLAGHMWVNTKVWDPEGIVSTLPAIASCLLGALAGYLVRSPKAPLEKVAWLYFSGNLLLLAGLFLDPWIPINKSLWTPSYTLLMAGLASLSLATFYWLCDVHAFSFTPLRIYGSNAIVMFVLSGLLGKLLSLTGAGPWLWSHFYSGLFTDLRLGSLTAALAQVVLLYGVAWLLYRRGIFVRL
ncbi:MAG: DUF5009 domain-containing protein [Bryobacteraceae bacterium]|nr:DUF5009 domain-containing protein [Bryobacteraceae bacterium]